MNDHHRRKRWRERSNAETDMSQENTTDYNEYTGRWEYSGSRPKRAHKYSPPEQFTPIQNNQEPDYKKYYDNLYLSQHGHHLERNNEGVDLPSYNIPYEDCRTAHRELKEESVNTDREKCGITVLDIESVRYAEEVAKKLGKRNILGIVSFMKEDTISIEEMSSIVARRGYRYAMFISEQNRDDETVLLYRYHDRKVDDAKILPTDDAINIIADSPDNHKTGYDHEHHNSSIVKQSEYEYDHHHSPIVQQTEYEYDHHHSSIVQQSEYKQLDEIQTEGHQQFVENNGVNVMNEVDESSNDEAYSDYIEKLLVELLKGKVLLVEQYDDIIKHVQRCRKSVKKRLRADRDNCIESGRDPKYRQREHISKLNHIIDSTNRMNPNCKLRYETFVDAVSDRSLTKLLKNPTISNSFDIVLNTRRPSE